MALALDPSSSDSCSRFISQSFAVADVGTSFWGSRRVLARRIDLDRKPFSVEDSLGRHGSTVSLMIREHSNAFPIGA